MRPRLLVVAVGVLMQAACGSVVGGSTGSDGGASSSSGGGSSGSSGSGSGGASSSSGSGSSGGGGSSSGGTSSSSGGGVVAGCPATQPMASGACSPVGLECEYGDSPSYQCTAHWTCGSGGSGWVFDDSVPTCVTGTCPPSEASVPNGQACTTDGLACAYPQGECNCATLGGPAQVEAGGPVWQCVSPGNCPEPRPRIGSPCAQPNQQCDYGACSGGVALQCTNGYWQRTTVPCPV